MILSILIDYTSLDDIITSDNFQFVYKRLKRVIRACDFESCFFTVD